jgi:transcriptional regulator with XRE-family HTH domain
MTGVRDREAPGRRICAGCRVTRLSRYNPEVLCGACTQTARTAPADAETGGGPGGQMPTWVWDSPLLRRALARTDLGAVMAVFRTAAGLSQLELAQILSCSQSTIWRIEAGERKSLYDIRELLRFADTVGMPRHALLPLVLGDPAAGDGRPVLADTGPATEPGLCTAIGVAVPAQANTTDARYLRACADQLHAQDQAAGGASVRGQALGLWTHARRMLDEASYSELAGRELASAAGELAVRAGWACYDSADPAQARLLYADALQLAGHAGDEILGVHAGVSLSLLLAHLAGAGRAGLARQAIWAAGQAADAARRNKSSRLHALIAAREAVARAAAGDSAGFRAAISRAWRELGREHERSDGDPAWLGFVRPAEITVHEAKGLVFLGAQGAAALYRDSLMDPSLTPRNRAVYQAQLAAVITANGDVVQAVAEADDVLSLLAGLVSSPRALAQLRPVRTAAERAGMAEFCARYDALIRGLPGTREPGTSVTLLALTGSG